MSEFGRPVRPHMQRSLPGVQHRQHHRYWLCLAVKDARGYLTAVEVTPRGSLRRLDGGEVGSWPELWTAIEDLDLPRGLWWAVGWRVRYALDRAGMLTALERGDICLPLRSAGRARGRKEARGRREAVNPDSSPPASRSPFAGSQTLTSERVSFDLCVGSHRVKFLELTQLGLLPTQWVDSVSDVTVDCVERAVEDYCRACSVVGLSASRTSAAQVGYARMRSHHVAACVCLNHDEDARAAERRAYFGGRNEAFRLGEIPGTTYSLDIRSCYAHICSTCTLPVYQRETYPLGLPVDRIDPDGGDHWIADCVLRTDTPDYPLRWSGSPIYPVGEFWTSLCWPELRHALHRGAVVRVTRAARYKAATWLAGFGDWFQASKANLAAAGLPHMTPTLKATFNASLGYTARQRYDWTPWKVGVKYPWWIGKTNDPDGTHHAVQAHVFDAHPEWMRVGGNAYDSIPYLHATICGYARVQMLRVLDAAGREHVYYCDTDGILCSVRGYDNIRNVPGLWDAGPGSLCERFPAGRCAIFGQKNYRIGANTVHAGAATTRRSATQEKIVLTTETGRVGPDGRVSPFGFWCLDEGDVTARWVNHLRSFDEGKEA